jgi:hypothetical protein
MPDRVSIQGAVLTDCREELPTIFCITFRAAFQQQAEEIDRPHVLRLAPVDRVQEISLVATDPVAVMVRSVLELVAIDPADRGRDLAAIGGRRIIGPIIDLTGIIGTTGVTIIGTIGTATGVTIGTTTGTIATTGTPTIGGVATVAAGPTLLASTIGVSPHGQR